MTELVVVPAYNEAAMIGRVVRDLFQHNWNNILVVNDGSTDATAYSVKAAGVKMVSHTINRGQGAALETGNEYARRNSFDVVVHFDGDGQLNAADIKGAIEKLNSGYDVVLGSRFLDNRSRLPWTKRYLILPVARFVNYILTGVSLSDAHNGFRVLNKLALEKIRITQSGMAHNSEIVAETKRLGLRYIEYPVEIKYLEYGQGLKGGIKIIFDWIFKS
jgi:glycosyltransferase involved in cell wall biosynthesis